MKDLCKNADSSNKMHRIRGCTNSNRSGSSCSLSSCKIDRDKVASINMMLCAGLALKHNKRPHHLCRSKTDKTIEAL